MRRLVTWSVFLLGTLAVGCSSDTQSPSGETGSLSLQLELGNGRTVNTVEWVITRGGMEPMSGAIDTSAPGATASIEVFGLEPGDGYRITMTAESADDDDDDATRCTGDTDFAVTAGEATEIMVVLSCKVPTRLGAVRANGEFNICTELTKMIVSPLQTSVGNTIDLSAIGEDAEGDEFEYMWLARGGTIADPSAAETTFTCETEGEGLVSVTVSDDGFEQCDAGTWVVRVNCVSDGVGAGGTGGAGGGDGGTGGDGAGGAGGFVIAEDPTDSVATQPLSSMMAVSLADGTGFDNIPDYTRSLVDAYVAGGDTPGFPLAVPPRDADVAQVIDGLNQNLVIKWFDPITPDNDADAPRFGANNDYLAYFGDGWDGDWTDGVVGSGPMFNGDPDAAWIWSNHEYISNDEPEIGVAPACSSCETGGQYFTLATFLADNGLIDGLTDPSDTTQWTEQVVNEHIVWEKKQHGGSWFRVERQEDGTWQVDEDPDALRYDSTDSTLATITGYTLSEPDTDDSGNPLPEGVGVGITADCSGGQTPWGTIFTAEENAQSQWGDFESAWVSSRQFILDDPAWGEGQNISPDPSPSDTSEFGRSTDELSKHNRDVYGFLVEIDPGVDPADYYESTATGGDGVGHRKLGSMGRARWENMDTVTDPAQELVDGQKIVFYAANDRRAGRIYKWVSNEPYMEGMTRGEVRALLDDGTLYVGHWEDLDALTGVTKYDPENTACNGDEILNGAFEGTDETPTPTLDTVLANCTPLTVTSPGNGVWIELSVGNTAQTAPNGEANGDATRSVGAALQDVNWNGVGGFPDDNAVLSGLFTAAAKLGVRELNRPEDVEWNPVEQALFIAFTYHGRTIGQTQEGTLVLRNSAREPVDRNGNVLDPGLAYPERGIDDLHSFTRCDNFGSLFRLDEANPGNPGESETFTFYPVFFGSGDRESEDAFLVARPDNVSIDANGGVWFGTDGNTSGSTNARSDGIQYLDLDPAHQEGAPGVAPGRGTVTPEGIGTAFRILSSANDNEATGPAWNSNMDTIFYNAQHPGEFRFSAWPSSQPELE